MNKSEIITYLLDTDSELIEFKLGEVVFNVQDSGHFFYLVKQGRLRVLLEDEYGQEQTVGYLYAGDHFGEGAILTGQKRRATVRAVEPCEIFRIDKSILERLIKSNNEILTYFEQQVAEVAYRNFTSLLRGKSSGSNVVDIQHLLDEFERVEIKAGGKLEIDFVERYFFTVGAGEFAISHGHTSSLLPGDFWGNLFEFNADGASGIVAEVDSVVYFLSKSAYDLHVGMDQELDRVLREKVRFTAEATSFTSEEGAQRDTVADDRVQLDVVTQTNENEEQQKMRLRGRRRWRFPYVQQIDSSDCGAACLAMICRYYDVNINITRLRSLANTSKTGTSLGELSDAAEILGFITKGVQLGYDKLRRGNLPAIIHWDRDHFVVVYKITPKYVLIADPERGKKKVGREAFEDKWTGRALFLELTPQLLNIKSDKSSFLRFLPFIKPHKMLLLEIFLASLVMSVFGLASPIFTQIIVDKVLVHQSYDLLNMMLIGMIIIAVFQMSISGLRAYLITFVSSRISYAMLSNFYKHMLSLPLRFFASRKTGDLITRFGENGKIQALLTGTTMSAILDILMLFVYLSLMIYYNAHLTLIVLAFIPFSALLTLIYTPILKSLSERGFQARAQTSSVLIDSLRGINSVKTSAIERFSRWHFQDRYLKEVRIDFQGLNYGILFGSVGGVLNLLSSTFLLWYGATLVIGGDLSIGQLMAFNAMIGNVTGPLLGLIGLWPQIQEARIALDRLNDIYQNVPEASTLQGNTIKLNDIEGRISFEDVAFSYKGLNSPDLFTLQNINLDVFPGQKIAVVGRSGAGKSTLLKLIPRLYDPVKGKVTLDGIDLQNLDLQWLRSQIGVVLQESYLFSGTVAENIALGVDVIKMDRIVEVCQIADIHDFICTLSKGYETKVGEEGVGLSGGQKQRLTIARALYPDPKILILDEATNSLDVESEQAIQDNLNTILADKTSFIIAHRLSTIRQADQIVLMDKGNIVEQGQHDELIRQKGLYYHLSHQQITI